MQNDFDPGLWDIAKAAQYDDEERLVESLLGLYPLDTAARRMAYDRAKEWVQDLRTGQGGGLMERLLQRYPLTTSQGVALMALAEALLRVPDRATIDALIADKLTRKDWGGLRDLAAESSLMIKMTSLGLQVTAETYESMVSKIGAPFIRRAVKMTMVLMGDQFVLGETITRSLKRAARMQDGANISPLRFSYDMLGEGARSHTDAETYFATYAHALQCIASESQPGVETRDIDARPGISVKLSGLHPRFETRQESECLPVLVARVRELALKAASENLALTLDAEESNRLDLQLSVVAALSRDPDLRGWNGLGLALQAYQKRAPAVIDMLADMAEKDGRRLQVRLVKGAYWDSEIKHAQVLGLADFPVYTRKNNTDLSYLVCARKLLGRPEHFYAQFGTHNAHTIAAITKMAEESGNAFEFQRLFGMGEKLYDRVQKTCPGTGLRIYAPVGAHPDLLPYLVRRLLENGANSSFVHHVYDRRIDLQSLLADPFEAGEGHRLSEGFRHPEIRLPRHIYGTDRSNSAGLDLQDRHEIEGLSKAMADQRDRGPHRAAPLIAGREKGQAEVEALLNPADKEEIIGYVQWAKQAEIDRAFRAAQDGSGAWRRTDADHRARILERWAELIEQNRALFMTLMALEGGKTWDTSEGEVREAADFCRYYAARGRECFAPRELSGPVGERNRYYLEGRGICVCISPWNFPLAIFTGQIAAALMAGNAVIAKPAEQTPLTALAASRLALEAGLPPEVLAVLPGSGEGVGKLLTEDPRTDLVAFTGGTETARAISRALLEHSGKLTPLIAETGGQNAMIIDSTALLERAVDHVINSAFGAAGQRCSALRCVYVQDDIAEGFIHMLKDALACLKIGDPFEPRTDIGPVIDSQAYEALEARRSFLSEKASFLAAAPMPEPSGKGHFFPPCVYEIDDLRNLPGEAFGPILHLRRFRAGKLESVIAEINATGYGLTFGMETRLDTRAQTVSGQIEAGNIYINRGMTGAVVGVQPFGGRGLSGTGPKAGGPHYLPRFAVEKVISTDLTAIGGNAALVNLTE